MTICQGNLLNMSIFNRRHMKKNILFIVLLGFIIISVVHFISRTKSSSELVFHKLRISKVSEFKNLNLFLQRYFEEKEIKSHLSLQTSSVQYAVTGKFSETIIIVSIENILAASAAADYCGSGGCEKLIILNQGRSYILISRENFIESVGYVSTNDKPPDLIFLCHGSIFGRNGNNYGYCLYHYNQNVENYVFKKEVMLEHANE